jgi:hypothetical protein
LRDIGHDAWLIEIPYASGERCNAITLVDRGY